MGEAFAEARMPLAIAEGEAPRMGTCESKMHHESCLYFRHIHAQATRQSRTWVATITGFSICDTRGQRREKAVHVSLATMLRSVSKLTTNEQAQLRHTQRFRPCAPGPPHPGWTPACLRSKPEYGIHD